MEHAKVRVVGNPAVMTTWINGVKVIEFDGQYLRWQRLLQEQVSSTLG